MSDKLQLLGELQFGSRTAESEMKDLARYFVETAQWVRIYTGERDVVYGPKGAGKSAIYEVLLQRKADLDRRGIIVKAAEQSEPIFTEIVVADPPESEVEWRVLWRAFFIGLAADVLAENEVEVDSAKAVFAGLEAQGLRAVKGAKAWLRSAKEFARRLSELETLEASAAVDSGSGAPVISARVKLGDKEGDPVAAAAAVASLLELANKALEEAGIELWILLDRLDVAFRDPAVEASAIRALMRVYLDCSRLEQITPKIFLRRDIWDEITGKEAFREGSHVVRAESITWNRDTLLNLAMRRILENESLCAHFGVEPDAVRQSLEAQEDLFERLFEGGESPASMLDWAIGSIEDGHGRSAPRELIHLLGELRDQQIERLQVGRSAPSGNALFDSDVRFVALREVSEVHLDQTLYTEIPKVRDFVEALRGGPVRFDEEQLKALWGDSVDSPQSLIKTLVNAGFLRRLPLPQGGFEVAMLYRPALELSTGVGDEA